MSEKIDKKEMRAREPKEWVSWIYLLGFYCLMMGIVYFIGRFKRSHEEVLFIIISISIVHFCFAFILSVIVALYLYHQDRDDQLSYREHIERIQNYRKQLETFSLEQSRLKEEQQKLEEEYKIRKIEAKYGIKSSLEEDE